MGAEDIEGRKVGEEDIEGQWVHIQISEDLLHKKY